MKRGNITKRGKNSWQLKFDVPAIDGKRKQRYSTVRGSYQEAQKELTRLLNEKDEGTLPDPSNATVAEYVRQWLNSTHEQSPKTSSDMDNSPSSRSSPTSVPASFRSSRLSTFSSGMAS
jgi:hypothetical protein